MIVGEMIVDKIIVGEMIVGKIIVSEMNCRWNELSVKWLSVKWIPPQLCEIPV